MSKSARAFSVFIALSIVGLVWYLSDDGRDDSRTPSFDVREVEGVASEARRNSDPAPRTPNADDESVLDAVETSTAIEWEPELVNALAKGEIEAIVMARKSRTPVEGAIVIVKLGTDGVPFQEQTDAAGRALFVALEAGEYSIRCMGSSGGARRIVRDGARTKVQLRAEPNVVLRGRCIDEAGAPVAGASISLSRFAHRDLVSVQLVVSDLEGRFETRSALPKHWAQARKAGWGPSEVIEVSASDNDPQDVTFVLQRESGALEGVVTGVDGALADVRVKVTDRVGDVGSRDVVSLREVARTDEEGRFKFEGLATGPARVTFSLVGYVTVGKSIRLLPGVNRCTAEMDFGGSIGGVVRDESGAVVPSASLRATRPEPLAFEMEQADLDGRYLFDGLGAGTYIVAASPRSGQGFQVRENVIVRQGQHTNYDPIIGNGSVLDGIVVIDEDSEPIRFARVSARPPENSDMLRYRGGYAYSNWKGQFEIDGLEKTPHRLVISVITKGRNYTRLDLDDLATVKPGDEGLVIHVPRAKLPSVFLVGTLIVDDVPIARPKLRVRSGERGSERGEFDLVPGEPFRLGPMVPGRRRIEIDTDSHGRVLLGEREFAPDDVIDLGDIRLPKPGRASVVVQSSGSVEGIKLTGHAMNALGFTVWRGVSYTGEFDVTPLAPGTYEFKVIDGERSSSLALTIASGQDHKHVLEF